MTDRILEQGREAQKCIFIAVEEAVAQDISDRIGALCDEVERLRFDNDCLKEACDKMAAEASDTPPETE